MEPGLFYNIAGQIVSVADLVEEGFGEDEDEANAMLKDMGEEPMARDES